MDVMVCACIAEALGPLRSLRACIRYGRARGTARPLPSRSSPRLKQLLQAIGAPGGSLGQIGGANQVPDRLRCAAENTIGPNLHAAVGVLPGFPAKPGGF